MPSLHALKTMFAVPNLAIAAVILHHVLDLALVRHQSVWPFFLEHPWFLFTAAVTLGLSAGHLILFTVRACDSATSSPTNRTPEQYRRWDLCLFGLDGAWAAMWILQLAVQTALPEERRAYTLDAVEWMMGLYAVQVCLTVPLVIHLFRAWLRAVLAHLPLGHDVPSNQ